jgi:hypothetical protein
MKKVTLNVTTDRTEELIMLLSDLEACDRDRLSTDGKRYLDGIWRLLGQPTYGEIEANKEKSLPNLKEEE